MNKKEWEQRIKNAFTSNVPHVLDAVLSDCEQKEGRGVIMTMENRKSVGVKKWIALVAVLAVVLTASVGALVYQNFFAMTTTVSLDVNPAIEIKVNQQEKVLSVEADNKDGQVVIGDMDLKGSSLDVAVNALIGSMVQKGYLTENANSILISVDGKDAQKSQELQIRLTSLAQEQLKQDALDGAVLGQVVTPNDDQLEALAQAHGISQGKAQLIQEIISQHTTYQFEELAPLSINELNLLCQRHDVNTQKVTAVGTASDKAYIGEPKAKGIALKHAGVADKDITDYEWEMDYEDGAMVYELDFDVAGYDYNYDINALTGEIAFYNTERDDDWDDGDKNSVATDKTGNSAPAASQSQTSKPASSAQVSLIGKDEAKQIALSHAGVSAEEIRNYENELDKDDGVVSYEIEFDAGDYEYTYDIHAQTGDVISVDKERLDDDDRYDD